ncbi:hypothetical protein [Clavibacter tessellarius]|uniref:PE-PPE domain-containing protein n=1 Tax=Clavibacter tessellarius TaxID=31965 RepID=A0A154V383_9MICO|nr:hypothetical protein [Clavibacter michiganensis]KZC95709.1 hypothetical protein AWH51_06545 [Clavibacter michiganensis subsp. tessellarius]
MTDLTVTTGGTTTVVATDDLLHMAALLAGAARRLQEHTQALALPPLVSDVTGVHDAALDLPRRLLSSAAQDAHGLAGDLRRAAAEYADGERDADRCVRSASPESTGGAADDGGGLGELAAETGRSWGDLLRLVGIVAPLVSHPDGPGRLLLPSILRGAVSDVAAAAARSLPDRPPGDDGTREATSALMLLLGAVGILHDGPAVVRARPVAPRPAPTTFQELTDRIPDPVPGAAQMRIEAYRAPDGGRRFVAYLGGMQTLLPGSVPDDFGPSSAVAALATERGSAVRAAEEALRDAGASATDEVYVVGYSQGGILARSVGDDPAFHVTHELTLGSPVGQLPLRQGIGGVAVEHTDDPVPPLGGARLSAGAGGDDVVVRAPAALGAERADPLSAHQLPTYRATAAEMDASRSPQLVRERGELRRFLDGATPISAHLYRAERVPEASSSAAGAVRPERAR